MPGGSVLGVGLWLVMGLTSLGAGLLTRGIRMPLLVGHPLHPPGLGPVLGVVLPLVMPRGVLVLEARGRDVGVGGGRHL